METHNRSSCHDSPHPCSSHSDDWITKPYSIVLISFVLFILIFGIAIFLGWRQFETTRHNALTNDKTTANLLSDIVLQHNIATIGILQSYAHRPLFIDAVKNKDVAGVDRHLSDLKKNAEIDLTFVTDARGLLWVNFPVFPEAIGADLSNRDWYKGVSSHWKPYISTVFKLIVGDKPLAVAICVPIVDEKERPIGILASSQRLGFLLDDIQKVTFSPYTTVNVIDRTGKILYSNKFPYQESITDYRFFPIFETAVKEKKQQIEMNDPQKDHEKSYLTVVPMGDIGWSVIIERSLRDIYRSEFGRFIEIGSISFLLFLLIIFFLIYLRKVSLFRKTEELLQAETKLRQSEENFHHSLDDSPMGVRIVTEEGKTIYANQAILDIYGYDSVEDLKTTPVEKRYTPESHADFLIRRKKRQQGLDVPSEYTINIIRKDGEVRHLMVLRREVLWDGERQFQVLYNDITDRKRTEVALQEREDRLRTIIEASLDAIIAVNVEGRLILFNGAAQELFQYSEEEALNQPVDILLREEIGKIHQERLERFLNRGVGQCGHIGRRTERPFRRKDGSLFEGEVSMSGGRHNGLRLVVFAIHDITSRKKTEEMLRESETRYRELFDNISSGVAIYEVTNNGNDFIFKDFNRAGERLDGDRKEDIIGKSIYQVRPGINKYGILEVFKRVWATGISEHYHAKFYQDERLQGWYDNFVYRLPFGEIVAVYGDITDRKRAEEELRESEEKYRNILENIEDGYFEVDLAGNFTFFNPSLCRILGYLREEMLGMNNRVFMDAENAKKVFRAFNEVYVTGIPRKGFDWETIRKDGARTNIEVSVSLISRQGEKPTGFRGIARNITERKRAEELLKESEARYRQLFENAPAGIYEIDLTTGRMLSVNDSMCEYTGYAKDELLTMNALDLLTEESQRIFIERKAGYPAGKPVTANLEFKARSKSGREFWISINPKYFYKEDIPVRASVVAHDITERKRLEAEKAQLETQNRQLQKAESLDRMAGAIAHNFNNQLQVVIGNLEMAMNDKPSDSEFLAEAMNAARKAADVSGLMLTYLGQKSGKQEPIDLSEVCRRRFTLLQSVAPKDMILKADLPLSGPVIGANADQILHVLTNLVTNAWESSEENRRSIDLTVKTVSIVDIPAFKRFPAGWNPQESVYACLEVADSGSGIACKDIENIFDPFYSTKFAGRGMGLSVVLGIVKAHNGGITVESKPGQGSVFRVYLPVTAEEVTRSPENADKVPEIMGGCTVLVVEDDEQVRKMLRMMLTHLSFTVFEARDGMEAVAVFKQHQNVIRCVLSDLTMPRMDGWQTLAALRKLSPDIPVILSSGYDEARVMAGEHTEQPNAFLGKPYQFKGLKDTICRVLADEK